MKPRFDIPRGEERAPRKAASLPLSPGKFDRILELARGKEVLDAGCAVGSSRWVLSGPPTRGSHRLHDRAWASTSSQTKLRGGESRG